MTSITTVKTPRRACHGAAAKPRRELGLVAGLYFVCPQGKSIFEDGFPQQASQESQRADAGGVRISRI